MLAMATTAPVVQTRSSSVVSKPMRIGIEKKPTQSKADPKGAVSDFINP